MALSEKQTPFNITELIKQEQQRFADEKEKLDSRQAWVIANIKKGTFLDQALKFLEDFLSDPDLRVESGYVVNAVSTELQALATQHNSPLTLSALRILAQAHMYCDDEHFPTSDANEEDEVLEKMLWIGNFFRTKHKHILEILSNFDGRDTEVLNTFTALWYAGAIVPDEYTLDTASIVIKNAIAADYTKNESGICDFFDIASEYEIDIFKRLLSVYGLSSGTRLAILNWHYRNTYYDESADSFSKLMLATVHRMESLEALHSGAVEFLSQKPYRIRMFCRYSAEYLAEVFELRDKDVPYVLCISAAADSNHSMYETAAWDVFEETRVKLRKLGFRIRAIEVSQKLPAAYAVLSLDAQIGRKYKNSGVWLRTHSHRHVVDLEGLDKERGHITSSDFESQEELMQKLRGTLAPHAQLIIDGCMTGREGGIAHSFTHVFDEVIGFHTSTTATSITPRKRSDGSLRFDVQYAKDVDDKRWTNEPGKVIKRK